MRIRPLNLFLRGFNPSYPNAKNIEDLLRGDKDMRGANLSGADLSKKNLRGIDFRGANLERANLREANLMNCNLEGANLFGANLESANFDHANLQFADLSSSKLMWTRFEEADLSYANLSRNRYPAKGINLRNANLEGITWIDGRLGEDSSLVRANITNANLGKLRIDRAYCYGADFSNSDLVWTSFDDTQLQIAKFNGANCVNMDFRDCRAQGTDFEEANLSNSSFMRMEFGEYDRVMTNFEGRRVEGLRVRNNWSLPPNVMDDLERRGATITGR